MRALAARALRGDRDVKEVEAELSRIADLSYLSPDQVREALIQGWEHAVSHFLDDGDLDHDEEKRLVEAAEALLLTKDTLDRKGAYTRFVRGAVIRDLMEGKLPQRLKVEGNMPFRFQKTEKLIWAFPSVQYYEDRVRRSYVGGHQGASFRIAKGVYYRVGAFRGHPVSRTERVQVGKGPLAITEKHVYFSGGGKALRIRHDKIVAVEPFDDAVGIHRDAQSAKPQYFVTGDGWFTYNLLMNVGNV